jgi:hypothetical protein
MSGHLVHIVYAKAGSKFLQRWFEAHPDLAYRTAGLGGFRSVYDLSAEAAAGGRSAWRVTSCEDLAAPRADVGSLVVDYERAMRSSWADRQSAARDLLALIFPGAHILIVTRGFRSMIYSSYSQFVRSGGREDLEALLGRGDDNHPWNYDRLIGQYREAFGAGRVIVLPYELLRSDPAAFTAAIEARLGLRPFPPDPDPVNASLSPAELRWYPRLSRLIDRLPVGNRVRRRLRSAWFRGIDGGRLAWLPALLQRVRPAVPVTQDLIGSRDVEPMRGLASSLRDEPLYRPFAADYLF